MQTPHPFLKSRGICWAYNSEHFKVKKKCIEDFFSSKKCYNFSKIILKNKKNSFDIKKHFDFPNYFSGNYFSFPKRMKNQIYNFCKFYLSSY